MSAEYEEVAVHILDIDRKMRRALRTIHQDFCTMFVGNARKFFHGIDRAEHIAHMCHTHQFCALCKEILIGFHIQASLIRNGNHLDDNALTVAQQLPRHNVGMMFHSADNDFVALTQECLTKTTGYEIDALRSAARENNLCRRARVNELAHHFTGCLVAVRSFLR